MKKNLYIELCIECENINSDNQRIYCRTDNRCCPKCGNNELVLICRDEVLEDSDNQ